MMETYQALLLEEGDLNVRYIGSTDAHLVVGRRYLVRTGCDAENWFQATYLGRMETPRQFFLHWDNDTYTEYGGCGTAIFDPALPKEPA